MKASNLHLLPPAGWRYKYAVPVIREDKPIWSQVPRAVRERVVEMLGARVIGARRVFGGYGPSATFVMSLDDGRRAFFKGIYPLPEGSAVRWRLDEEERVYQELADLIDPWAPAYYGSLRIDGWHALLIEALGGARVPPWTASRARRAIRSYADFHAHTLDTPLPDWLPRDHHLEFTGYWAAFTSDDQLRDRLAAVRRTPEAKLHAADWMATHGPTLAAAEAPLVSARRFALLHFDTRSDNIRLDGSLLRIFDWPFACAGPAEFDFAAFAQSINLEGGPDPEQLTAWYSEVLPLEDDVLTASVVGLSGFFADRGSSPDLPGLPRLRAFQRKQLKSSLTWAAHRLRLPPPTWLDTLAD
ncbi:MAG TPA: phosphotransferase [Candidatus Limnocylindrales bacterium]